MVVRNNSAQPQATRVRKAAVASAAGVNGGPAKEDAGTATIKLKKKVTASLRTSPEKRDDSKVESHQQQQPQEQHHQHEKSSNGKGADPSSAGASPRASANPEHATDSSLSPAQQQQQSEAPKPGADSDRASPPFVHIAPAAPSAAVAPDTMGLKLRKPDAPKFLLMLYEILQNESDKIIRWTDDGLALQILEQNSVTEKVLPKYFNHTNFHSFQRQLNYFGFRKWTKSKTDICTFSHPYFRRNQPELMHLIKRKKATRRVNAVEQAEMFYPTEKIIAAAAQLKKLLPSSPTGKRKYTQERREDEEQQQYSELSGHGGTSFNGASPNHGALPMLANGAHLNSNSVTLAPLNHAATLSGTGHSFLPPAASLTNAISPASGGAKKKAKTSAGNKSYSPEPAPPQPPKKNSSAVGSSSGAYNNQGTLPNLDMVRNRLYQQPPNGMSGQIPGFVNGFGASPPMSIQHPSSLENSSAHQCGSTSSSSMPTPPSSESSSQFTNSFSDPVDILLRIKKSRAMSHDNTVVQSPQQRAQGQADSFASLQNFLLSQSLYTNRLESQLKLALDENEALRTLADNKQREVETLLSERKMIQNENSVLTEDKNKLFEINRDLLSKLFPQ